MRIHHNVLRSLCASVALTACMVMTQGQAQAGFLIEEDRQERANAENVRQQQPLGVKKRITGWMTAPIEAVTSANVNSPLVPCVVGAKYEEGTFLRFSGGAERIVGISVVKNFGIFKAQYRYPVSVTFAGQETERYDAIAVDERTLVIAVSDSRKMYQQVQRMGGHFAPYVSIAIADFSQNYALDDIGHGLESLEACYFRRPLPVIEDAPVLDAQLDAAPAAITEMDALAGLLLSEEDLSVPVPVPSPRPVVARAENPVEAVPVEEPVRGYSDLSAAERQELESYAALDAEEDAMSTVVEDSGPEPLRLVADLAEKEDAERAQDQVVDQGESLLIESATVVERIVEAPVAPVVRAPAIVLAAPVVEVATVVSRDLGVRHSIWVASKGESVASVLKRWSKKSNVEFQWQRRDRLPIRADSIYRGSYDEVTQKLLVDYGLASAVLGGMAEAGETARAVEEVLPEDTVSRSQSQADAKKKKAEPGAVEKFFGGLFGSSKSSEGAVAKIEAKPRLRADAPRTDAVLTPIPTNHMGRKFPKGDSAQMIAMPAQRVEAVHIEPAAQAAPIILKPGRVVKKEERHVIAAPARAAVPASAPVAAPVAPIVAPVAAPQFMPQVWRALKGANLREVMQVWAEDAGVSLNWKSQRNYAVRDSVSLKVPFDHAVSYTLDLYDIRQARPMGHLFVQEDGGKPVLTIYDSE